MSRAKARMISKIFTGKILRQTSQVTESNLGWGTEVLLKMATSDCLPVIRDGKKIIKEPRTAVSPSFGLISVVHFNDGELDDCLHLLIKTSEDGGCSLSETERSQ